MSKVASMAARQVNADHDVTGWNAPCNEPHRWPARHKLLNPSLDLPCIATVDGYFKWMNPAFERGVQRGDQRRPQPICRPAPPVVRTSTP
jgi:hypothetical protein